MRDFRNEEIKNKILMNASVEILLSCAPELQKGSVVQLVRMPPCHGGGRGFESRPVR